MEDSDAAAKHCFGVEMEGDAKAWVEVTALD